MTAVVALPTVRFRGVEIVSLSGRSWGATVDGHRVLVQIRLEDVAIEGEVHEVEQVIGHVDPAWADSAAARIWACGPTPQLVADDLDGILRDQEAERARG